MEHVSLALRVAVGILLFVVGFSLLQFVLGVFPLKYSVGSTPAERGMEFEEVGFETSDGLELSGWFVPAEGSSSSTVIVGHGYPFDKSNVVGFAQFLHEDHNLLFFDFRSFGGSEGRVTTVGLRETRDVDAAVRYLQSREKVEHIGALGFSMSASTFLMADNRGIDAVVAESPYAGLDVLLRDVYSIFPGPLKEPFVWMTSVYSRLFLGAWPSEVSPAESIQGSSTPVLLIHGSEDSQIPVEHSRRIYEASDKNLTELWIVEGAGHGRAQAVAGEEYRQRVRMFFDEHLE